MALEGIRLPETAAPGINPMIENDPDYQAYHGLKTAMEAVSTYAGQDGLWYATIKVEAGVHLEGPFDSQDEAQEGGLRVAMSVDLKS